MISFKKQDNPKRKKPVREQTPPVQSSSLAKSESDVEVDKFTKELVANIAEIKKT